MTDPGVHVLHVLADYDGGGAVHAAALARHAAASGAHVRLAVPGEAPDGILTGVAESDVVVLPRSTRGRAAAVARLARGADVVHAHGAKAAAWSLPALTLRPSLVTFHGLHPLRRSRGRGYRFLARRLVEVLAAAADAVICVSESEARDLRQLNVSARKLHVVPNGVEVRAAPSDEERAAARASLALNDGVLAVLLAGRLHEQKDPLTAVRAARSLPAGDVVLLIAGDGELMPLVRAEARDNVRVLGRVPGIQGLLAASDVVVNTSLWEGLPLVVLEAMANARAVVASDAPGNVEALGDAGVIVPRRDPAAFAAALDALRDADRRNRLARLGRARVEGRFRLDEMLTATDAVYEQVLARRGHARVRGRVA
jgi:glycosyltransferase involved in cell wall biosynthesis